MDFAEKLDFLDDDCDIEGFPITNNFMNDTEIEKETKCRGDCHWTSEYGFVPEADCPVHDKPNPVMEEFSRRFLDYYDNGSKKPDLKLFSLHKDFILEKLRQRDEKWRKAVEGLMKKWPQDGLILNIDNYNKALEDVINLNI